MRLVPRSDLATAESQGCSEKRCFTWLVEAPLSIAAAIHYGGRVTGAFRCGTCRPPKRMSNLAQSDQLTPLQARASAPLTGAVRVPGDKSISHRALILGALAVGETRIGGLLEGEDVLNTAKSMRSLGATVERTGEARWSVRGVG